MGTRAARGRPGEQLEVGQAPAGLAQRRADAVRARIPAADHDDVPALGGECRRPTVEKRPGALGQVLHGEMHAGQRAGLPDEPPSARVRGTRL